MLLFTGRKPMISSTCKQKQFTVIEYWTRMWGSIKSGIFTHASSQSTRNSNKQWANCNRQSELPGNLLNNLHDDISINTPVYQKKK